MESNQDFFIQPNPLDHYGFLKDFKESLVGHELLSPGIVKHLAATGRAIYSIFLILPPNGLISAQTLLRLTSIMRLFGLSGRRTQREGFELIADQDVKLNELLAELQNKGFVVGGTGAHLYQIESCVGFLHCQNAIVDSPSLAQGLWKKLKEYAFEKELPSALRIGVSGCPNQCGLAVLNDLGLSPLYLKPPEVKKELLKTKDLDLKLLRQICPTGALKVRKNKEEIALKIDSSRCSKCTSCLQAQPELFQQDGAREVIITLKKGNTKSPAQRVVIDRVIIHGSDYEAVSTRVRYLVDLWVNKAKTGEEIGDTLLRLKKEGANLNLG